MEVLLGNAWNSMGDAAYGDCGIRQDFVDAGRRLEAQVPGEGLSQTPLQGKFSH